MNINKILIIFFEIIFFTQHYASINVKPDGGGGGGGSGGKTPGICGAFDFLEDFLVKIPTVGPKTWSNQIKYPQVYHQFIIIENE